MSFHQKGNCNDSFRTLSNVKVANQVLHPSMPFRELLHAIIPDYISWSLLGRANALAARSGFSRHVTSSQLYCQDLGVSENSVPLNPMVLLIIIPIKWLFHWEYTQHFQTYPSASAKVPNFIVVTDFELQDIGRSHQELRCGIPNRVR